MPLSRKPFSRETLGLLLGFVGITIFGGTLPVTRIVVAGLDPLFLAAGRGAGGGVLALVVLWVMRQPFPKREHWLRMFVNMLCLAIGFPLFSALGSVSVPSAHGGVVIGLTPLLTAIVAAIWSGERPSVAFWLCSCAGASVVVVYALRQAGGGLAIGDLYLLAAVGVAAIGYTLSAELSRVMPGWVVISWALVFCFPFTAPVALWYWPANPMQVPATIWLAFAYLFIFPQYLGFFAWNAGLAMGGTARVSQVQLLQTFVTITLAALIVGETIDAETIIAAIVVVGLVFLGRTLRIGQKPRAI